MTAATVADLLGPARAHLDAAVGSGSPVPPGQVAAAARATARITHTLMRCLGDIAPYPMAEAITSSLLDERARAAVDAREALRMAVISLHGASAGPPEPDPGAPGPLVAHLRAAAAPLRGCRDLLRTHFGTGADGQWSERSDWSAVITSPPVTRALLAEVASWSRHLAFLTGRLSLASAGDAPTREARQYGLAGACHLLLTAAAALTAGQRADPPTAADGALLEAIPVNTLPARQPPQQGETVAELASGVEVSAARLRRIAWAQAEDLIGTATFTIASTGQLRRVPWTVTTWDQADWSPAVTADSWQWTATAAAVICDISRQWVTALLEHPGLAAGLPKAGSRLRAVAVAATAAHACTRWRQASAAWNELVTETQGLTAPNVSDTADVVVRLGRLVFANPGWTPAGPGRIPVRDVAPGGAHCATVIGALHHAVDALALTSTADLRAVTTAARERVYVLTRSLPDGYDVPYRFAPITPAGARHLAGAYQAACHATSNLLTEVSALAAEVQAPSRILAAARAAAQSRPMATPSHPPDHQAAVPGQRPTAVAGRPASEPAVHARPGPVEQAVRGLHAANPILLMRASAIDTAARTLIAQAKGASQRREGPRRKNEGRRARAPRGKDQARVAAASFPGGPAIPGSGGRADQSRRGPLSAARPTASPREQPGRHQRHH